MDTPSIHIALISSEILALAEDKGADHIYFRADRCVDRDLVGLALLKRKKPVIFALRSVAEGGTFAGTRKERTRILAEAAKTYDYVELECDRDLIPELLEAVAPVKRIVS